jgi:hypothetical protein
MAHILLANACGGVYPVVAVVVAAKITDKIPESGITM